MPFELQTATWILIADWTIRIAALLWIPARSPPAAARSWLLLVGFVPLFGLPLYLALGQPWLSRERRTRQAAASRVIAERQQPLHHLRWTPHDDAVADDIARLGERLGDFMPMPGNAVALLDDYDASIQSLLDDINGARFEVHLLYYLMFGYRRMPRKPASPAGFRVSGNPTPERWPASQAVMLARHGRGPPPWPRTVRHRRARPAPARTPIHPAPPRPRWP